MSTGLYCPKCQKSAPCQHCSTNLLDHMAENPLCPVLIDGRIAGYGPTAYQPQSGWSCCVRTISLDSPAKL